MIRKEDKSNEIREKIMHEIINYFLMHGYAPTIKEIGEAVGLASSASVSYHINALLEEGRLETDAKIGASRAYRVKGMRVVFAEPEMERGKKNARKN